MLPLIGRRQRENKTVYLARLTNDVCRLPEIFKGSMAHHYSLEGFAKLALMLRRQKQSLDAIRKGVCLAGVGR